MPIWILGQQINMADSCGMNFCIYISLYTSSQLFYWKIHHSLKSIRNYIWHLSATFSISSLIRILMTSFSSFSRSFVQLLSLFFFFHKVSWSTCLFLQQTVSAQVIVIVLYNVRRSSMACSSPQLISRRLISGAPFTNSSMKVTTGLPQTPCKS